MARPSQAWIVSVEGYPEVSTNAMTLSEVEVVEQVCGVPYTLLNPHSSIRVAKALLVVLVMRAGASEDAALQLAGNLPVEVLHGAFRYVEGDEARTTGAADPPPSAPTSTAG